MATGYGICFEVVSVDAEVIKSVVDGACYAHDAVVDEGFEDIDEGFY